MKRSQVNEIMREADDFMRSYKLCLPPFAYWTPEEFVSRKAEAAAIVEAGLGWDITDFGLNDFDAKGLFLFTARNGLPENLKQGAGIVYAEKMMISRLDQVCPIHRHIYKTEDIINRGGGTLTLELFASDNEGKVDEAAEFSVPCDGMRRSMKAGEELRLEPGESVTLYPGIWHAFWGEGGDVLVGEVSTVNDDRTDNVFRDSIGRFSPIEEDEAPLHLLVSDYERWLT